MMVKLLMMVVAVMMGMAFCSFNGSMQLSVGPQTVGVWMVLQPFADAVKLLAKESIIPNHANTIIFLLALAGWTVISFGMEVVLADMNMGMLYLFAVSSLGAYAVLCSGWTSNRRYSFLGALSATAQMISYEVSIRLIIFLMLSAEKVLVLEFHTEHSVLVFVLFFLNKYGYLILMSYFNILLFLGSWLSIINLALFTLIPKVVWLVIKGSFFLFLFIWTRAFLLSPTSRSSTTGLNNFLYLISFTGLSWSNPVLVAVFMMSLLSLTGMPPLSGFFGTWLVFSSMIYSQFDLLAIFSVLSSLISDFYFKPHSYCIHFVFSAFSIYILFLLFYSLLFAVIPVYVFTLLTSITIFTILLSLTRSLSSLIPYWIDWFVSIIYSTNIELLGKALYTDYAFYLLLIGCILLLAILSGFTWTMLAILSGFTWTMLAIIQIYVSNLYSSLITFF